jgi:hypothetical protein
MTVVADDDWVMAVTPAPVAHPTILFDETALRIFLIRSPADICRPSVMVLIPRINRPKPPRV